MFDKLSDPALLLGSALRLTRLVTSDDVGRWYLREPAYGWACHPRTGEPYDPAHEPQTARQRLVSGLDCPHCVGFWASCLALASYAATARSRRLRAAWRGTAAALTLGSAVGHMAARLDHGGDDE